MGQGQAMADPSSQEELFVAERVGTADRVVAINARCQVRTRDGHCIVVVGGLPVAQFAESDRMAATYAAITLIEQGWAEQKEAAAAFDCSTRTLRRAQERFAEGGLAALGRSGGYPKGRPRLRTTRTRHISDLKAQGLSNRDIAGQLGVTEKAVRKQLRRLGWKQATAEQGELGIAVGGADPNLSALTAPALGAAGASLALCPGIPVTLELLAAPSGADPNMSASVARELVAAGPSLASGAGTPVDPRLLVAPPGADPNMSAPADDEPLPFSSDTDPADRRMDRLFACLGLLDDAAPLFRAGQRVPGAGVLLAIPALIDSGVFECAQELYGNIGPAFYGLRTTFVALLLMALLRIRRVESLKEHEPTELGRLLGLDRAPEVKTLRRKLIRLAKLGCATPLGRALAQRRVDAHGSAMGFLYVDGHVRAYHGKHAIPGTHVARLHASMPATSDYWIGDQRGDPLFVLTVEANAGMVKMLPPLLDEVRAFVGDDRRVTIVFDRGGWSPALFRQLLSAKFDLLTYRKGRIRRLPANRFHQRQAVLDGTKVRYSLADQGIRLKGGPRLRQVTMLCDSGHQTTIVTSRRDLSDIEVAYRMFERWRQENFFKYLREEYALDVLVDYQIEPASPSRDVPNPNWKAADQALRKARAEATKLAAQFGHSASANSEERRPTMRGFKIANAAQGRRLREALDKCRQIEAFRAKVPRRVPASQAADGQPVIQLATERKHLTNLIKMVAYQAESELLRLIAPHYARATEEGRTLVQSALSSAADITVTDTELCVTLAPLSSPHRTRAVAALCAELNRAPVRFPGTRLRLSFAIASPEPSP